MLVPMARVAFVGLGAMGAPMAGHLAAAGHQVTVYNRTRSKADQWVRQHDNASAPTPADAADGAELVMLCVGNDDDVRAVVHGDDGVLATMADRVDPRRPHDDVGRAGPRGRGGVRRARASGSSTRPCPAARPAPRPGGSR